FGPFLNRSSQDRSDIKSFLFAATAGHPRGVLLLGSGAIQSLDPGAGTEPDLQSNLGSDLVNADWHSLSGSFDGCPDLIPSAAITTNGDVYAVHSGCNKAFD